jgi:hypothetical protein
MVYKKYIEKDGKVYGPYVYKSHRINGKIVSEYCGQGKVNKKNVLIFVAAGLILFILIFSFFSLKGKFTGNTISENPNLISSETENVISYPIVYFTLVSIQNQVSESSSEQVVPLINETILPENSTESNIENSSEKQEIAIDNSTTPIDSEINSSENIPSETSNTAEEIIPEETPNNEQEIIPDVSTSEQKADSTEPLENQQVPLEPPISEQKTSAISENIVSDVLSNVGNFFLGLFKTTGMAISEQLIETNIEGKVSINETFVYQLKEGENVQLLPGSVKTDSGSLSDNAIKMIYQDNLILVSTNYSEIIKLSVNTSKNSTLKIIKENIPALTDDEEIILSETFKNLSIETVKSELFNGRYILGYKLEDFSIEYSYSSTLDEEVLSSQIEYDKIKWLKDISNKLREKELVHNFVNLS